MAEPLFKVGDLVRLKTGKSPQKVMQVMTRFDRMSYVVRCAYMSDIRYAESCNERVDAYCRKTRPESDFVLYEEEPIQQLPGVEPMADLYQLKKNSMRFGIAMMNSAGQVVRNSQGHMILEMKGENGKVEAFPEDELELVTPYTVNLHRLSLGESKAGDQIHVIAEAGQVKKDDVLLELNSGMIWRVTALDTKCRSPKTNVSKWIKIQTEAITFGAQE